MKGNLAALMAAVGLLVAASPAGAASPAPAAADVPIAPSPPAEPAMPAPPTAPTGVTATVEDTRVVVRWQVSQGAGTYVVTETPGGRTCAATGTECVLAGLPSGWHSFHVVAAGAGGMSPMSEPTSATWVPKRLLKPILSRKTVVVGKSVRGRRIVATRQGNPKAPTVLLVVGQMHGSEPAGLSVVSRLRRMRVARDSDYQLWTIRTMNPDGAARGHRYNARGIDLNRNFPGNWSTRALRSGGQPASEPETRAVMRFLKRLRPDGVLSFHQPWDAALSMCDTRSAPWVRRVAELIRLDLPAPRSCGSWYPGTMSRWFARATGGWFVTVELAGRTRAWPQIPRAASAVATIAQEMADAEQMGVDVIGSK